MLLYNSKPSLHGAPEAVDTPGAPYGSMGPAQFKAQDLVADSAVGEILPAGGLKILNAQEPIAKAPTKEAQAVLAKALTEDAKAGIRAMTVIKYVLGFAPMLKADKAKRAKELIEVTAKLRAWGAANLLYVQALNERMNAQVVADLQSAAKLLNTLGVPASLTTVVVGDVGTLKDAESKLLLAQVDRKGGGDLKLFEFRGIGMTDVTKITWFGPVAARVRVAKLADNPNKEQVESLKALFGKLQSPEDDLPLDKVPALFPVPDIVGGKFYDWVNPQFEAYVPGNADNLHFDAYQYLGMNKGPAPWDDTKPFAWGELYLLAQGLYFLGPAVLIPALAMGAVDLAELDTPATTLDMLASFSGLLQEQMDREYGENSKKKPVPDTVVIKEGSKVLTTTPAYSYGFMIDVGLTRDPEWGSKTITERRTPHWVADNTLPKIRQWHQTRRVQLTAKDKFKAVGEAASVQAKQAKVKGAVADLTILPPIPLLWFKQPNGTFKYGPASLDVWQKYVENAALEVHLNYLTWVQTWNKRYWGGKGPNATALLADVADTANPQAKGKLAQWKPGHAGGLPYPLVYPLASIEPKLPQYGTLALQKWSEVTAKPLTAEQEDLITVRSDYKASLLTGMRAAEFAEKVFSEADELFAAIQSIVALLYGPCTLTAPPEGTPKEKLYKHYLDQTDACAASPQEGSLCSVLTKAEAIYADLKAKAEAGDGTAKAQALALSEQIAKTQARVNVLIAELKGKLLLVKSDLSSEGGVEHFVSIAVQMLDVLSKVPSIMLGGVKINLPPSDEEVEEIKALGEKIKLINTKYLDLVGKVGAMAETLGKTAEAYGVELGGNVSGGLVEVKTWSQTTLGEEKSFPWLLLLAVAAAARE